MSIIGATNSGGGGNNISITSAMLQVFAPLGSIVTATKDGITKTSKKDIIVNDRPTVGMHLISISNSQLGTWVITATRGEDSNTSSIIIDGVKEEYEVYIGYHVPIGEYQEVEYLQSSGSQYINVNLTNTNGATLDFQYVQILTGANTNSIYGARNDWSARRFGFGVYNNKFWVIPESDTSGTGFPTADLNKHHLEFGEITEWKEYIDEQYIFTSTETAPSTSNTYIFAENVGGVQNPSRAKVYYLALFVGNEMKRELFPCYRLVDSVAGLYDKINGIFYTNIGSGTFIVGADV